MNVEENICVLGKESDVPGMDIYIYIYIYLIKDWRDRYTDPRNEENDIQIYTYSKNGKPFQGMEIDLVLP